MNRKQSIKALALMAAAPSLIENIALSQSSKRGLKTGQKFTAYLMAHFKENDQKLYYAYSRNAADWTALNNRKFVLDAHADLRDPYIQRVTESFHLVHTKGWDHPEIFHWESKDLITWEGGSIQVVPAEKKRAWAPEFVYLADEDLFYVFWASQIDDRNVIHYLTTKDWKNIDPTKSQVYYDLGIDDIDLTIVKHSGIYYGFHKPGSIKDNMDISLITSPTLNKNAANFGFGKKGRGVEPLPESTKPIEGPQVIQLIEENRWYVYADPFHNNFMAWETTDFKSFKKIPVSTPRGSKHCSMIAITEDELTKLLEAYPV